VKEAMTLTVLQVFKIWYIYIYIPSWILLG
jgi:hypothetical protein